MRGKRSESKARPLCVQLFCTPSVGRRIRGRKKAIEAAAVRPTSFVPSFSPAGGEKAFTDIFPTATAYFTFGR